MMKVVTLGQAEPPSGVEAVLPNHAMEALEATAHYLKAIKDKEINFHPVVTAIEDLCSEIKALNLKKIEPYIHIQHPDFKIPEIKVPESQVKNEINVNFPIWPFLVIGVMQILTALAVLAQVVLK